MGIFTTEQRRFAKCIGEMVYCNPFVPERIDYERQALGNDFAETPRVWSLLAGAESERANLAKLVERIEPLAEKLRDRLAGGAKASRDDLVLYGDLVLYMLYQRDRMALQQTIAEALEGRRSTGQIRYWKQFKRDFDRYLRIPRVTMPVEHDPAHIFAVFFQIRRAFYQIFTAIIGGSMPTARLRASVWQSIFTHDMRRYIRVLYKRMADYTTLVTGPSGTGKELVARAIGQARYIPFDAEAQKFTEDFASSFHAVNLSALSPTLIESELFGHKRGAFTGAVADRAGWLELCGPMDTVFLDEIGEVDPAIQVKLLRVLQTRVFQRIGETKDRQFRGKIIAATNRDLARDLAQGGFRTDFYYRLCSDIITTPSLHEQLVDDPADLYNLVLFIAKICVEDEAQSLAEEVTGWIEENLGRDYPWPGNFRELEQCVRNILIRKSYQPAYSAAGDDAGDSADDLAAAVRDGEFTADELLQHYCTLVYAKLGSYEQAARRLQIDRRTVRSKINEELLAQLKAAPR
ncbi:MAG: sigma 54-interacting transcriptional regulator [Planctomycetes bacterium]|nr:sigma 54-interacting transcriptional regulator [Planctomycetota bacterium]